ncbi:MAG: peptide chain release factor N(5)-glutamine methyltransferase [Flavobacteriales bacterium]|nr:peptide chain release factor N(5)-glutamine methyltransferase [Flavobacteriia bacterium]NCP05637.1 peptide chain release factor N(5)-glutamine methyltransferase [Flavobacteriales bacterium]PIV94660.1 MAG: peptide chain release factor N(5)-glutamine methyltransferase [Flavobacteriaceae bacterium CG17_big_fil_post_rev_8_21_14_2_50_33_15]PIY09685.1 MAG: peptide chain release factor N(5)-glutamine methyltransferase [Flavobacteriaceae bacterium CG_4_10_14_3_um_filter_33_47]PJB16571.1 MAG: peptide
MTLKHLQNIFHIELDAMYGKDEVDSFFYLLIGHYHKIKRLDLALEPAKSLSKKEEEPLFEALSQLKLEKPIQYILGETEFYNLKFKVTKDTLIPRPETEELIDWIISKCKTQKSELKVLDIGTGSGCIAISLAKHLPNASIYALDISKKALKIAKENALINTVKVRYIEADILRQDLWTTTLKDLKFDIIVSNPPYVRHLEKKEMKGNVLKHEPELALFVENDTPLIFYKAICEFSQQKLNHGGSLFFEINQYLGKEMYQLLSDYNFEDIKLKKDLFDNNRMIKGIKVK